MARESYVYDRQQGKLVDAAEFYAKQQKGVRRSGLPAPQVMRDIAEFRNVAVDGKMITSRSQKREMMKEHGLVEVGNEKPKPKLVNTKPSRASVRASIKRSLQQLGA